MGKEAISVRTVKVGSKWKFKVVIRIGRKIYELASSAAVWDSNAAAKEAGNQYIKNIKK